MAKVYEITDKSYRKYYVRGLKNDRQAIALGRRVLKKYFFDISYYHSDHKKYRGKTMTITEFKKYSWRFK